MEKKMMKSNGAGSRSSAMKRRRLFSAAAVLLAVCLVFVGAAGAAEYVAEIGDTGYPSIQKAVEMAVDGDVIKVIADHELNVENTYGTSDYDAFILVDGKGITIDLNGHKVTVSYSGNDEIYSVIGVANTQNSKLIMTDTSLDKTGTLHVITNPNNPQVKFMLCNLKTENGGKNYNLVINAGSYLFENGKNAGGIVDARGSETTLVTGGNFNMSNTGKLSNGSPWIFNTAGNNERNIIVEGGTFNADVAHQHNPFESVVSKEKALVKNPTANIWTIVDAVAYVNEQEWSSAWYTYKRGYTTLKEALENAGPAETRNGKTSNIEDVYLLADFTGAETLNINKDVTINLNGHTILWKGGVTNPTIFTVDGGETLTIESFKIGDEFKIECVGYEIDGWYTKDADGNDVSLEENNGKVLTSLYAKEPIPIDYTITVTQTKGGSVSASPSEANYRNEIELTSTPHTGYEFEEWMVITDNEESVSVADSKFIMPPDNVTVTAKFVPLQYTVTFDADGGTPAPTELRVTYDAKYANLPNVEKEGYTFLYWKHEDGSKVTNETEVKTARHHILTAVWEEIPDEENSAEGDVAPPSSGGGGDGGHLSFPRFTENGGLVDFGSSKVVKALMLPEGSSGSVLLKVDTVEKWPKALDTEYTFDISVEKLGDGMAYIHFEIPVSVLESLELTPADICAYHFEGEVWTKLPTTYEVKDGTVCYEAETDSFSPFKLVIEEGAAVPKEEETVPVIPPTEEPDVPDEPEILPPIDEPTKPADEPETPAPILAVLAGLGAAFIVRRK